MTTEQIEAIGHFLAYYKSDLNYINQFQNYIGGKLSAVEYINRSKGSFYSFLIEFKIVRNFKAGQIHRLLEETTDFIKICDNSDVDWFALKLSQTDFTGNKVVASMASKILFLNDPCSIIPMDSRARRALGQRINKYDIYNHNLSSYITKNENIVTEMLDYVQPLISVIHKDFPLLGNKELIAKNRIIDKLLWTTGK
ncbi:hypothetical protein HZP42_01060 [Elizabethkingia anophelis]|uniref:hypothetical protein n=1 Tax=Elizabethkingia anophelis TaxID=1117645 RepID=UPI000999D5CB|nr:hypothetical protein [Elizabethkingia anophelis]MCT4234966.1 hypothetical protein [Elizabethkingia anophelis]OPC30730.1 hypothetical protein BAX98_08980 [Elizabethkingia anophelis]